MFKPLHKVLEYLRPFKVRARLGMENLTTRFQLLSPREKKAVIVSTAVLGIFLADAVVIHPWIDNLRRLDEKISMQEKQTMHHLRSVGQKSKVDQVYLRLWQSLDSSDRTDDEIRATMLRDIEEQARANGLNLSEVKPQVSSEGGEIKTFSVRLQADGRMPDLALFFAELVKKRKLYFIESFRITPHPEDLNKIRAGVVVNRAFFREQR